MEAFPARLKRLREKQKNKNSQWTQEYVADKIGVARPTYTAYEVGSKQPPLETINKLADLFGVSTDYLLGRTDEPEPKSDGEMYFFDKDKWSDEEIEEARAFIEARRMMKKNKKS